MYIIIIMCTPDAPRGPHNRYKRQTYALGIIKNNNISVRLAVECDYYNNIEKKIAFLNSRIMCDYNIICRE